MGFGVKWGGFGAVCARWRGDLFVHRLTQIFGALRVGSRECPRGKAVLLERRMGSPFHSPRSGIDESAVGADSSIMGRMPMPRGTTGVCGPSRVGGGIKRIFDPLFPPLFFPPRRATLAGALGQPIGPNLIPEAACSCGPYNVCQRPAIPSPMNPPGRLSWAMSAFNIGSIISPAWRLSSTHSL